jgi:hypothetical protein
MKLIPLSQGLFAKVSDEDFEYLSKFKWSAKRDRGDFRAMRKTSLAEGYRSIYMHRVILGLDSSDKRVGDHINHDTLDNTRENLRIADLSQSAMNRRIQSRKTCKYKGVFTTRRNDRWVAIIAVKGKNIHLGTFGSQEEAHEAYCVAANRLHGEFSCL